MLKKFKLLFTFLFIKCAIFICPKGNFKNELSNFLIRNVKNLK